MSGSFIFYFHLLGFGLVTTLVISGWILNLRFRAEKNLPHKLYVAGIMRVFGILSPVAALLLLLTGIGNIYNLYYETTAVWYQQGWLDIKIILFSVMFVNGTLFGPSLSRKRTQIVREMIERPATPDEEQEFKNLNSQIVWFYVVQSVLLLGILFFSAFGTSKHPGYF